MDVGNEEMNVREKNLSWQDITYIQIAVDTKEKLGNQEEVFRGGIILIYLPFLIKRMKTMPRSYQQSATYSQKGTGKVLSISLKL